MDLFSGIGGFALAADRVFGEVEHTFCEIDPFCQEVLKKHWPQATIYGDIRRLKGHPTDIVTGGFPCQPFSQAGQRKGTADNRDLWPEMFRVIQESKPTWIIGENVAGFINMELERTVSNLEAEGYEVQPLIIPAVALNAPHRRDRVWIIAFHAEHAGLNGSKNGEGGIERSHSHTQGQDENEQPPRPAVARDNSQDTVSKRSSWWLEGGGQVLGSRSPEAKDARPDWASDWLTVATRLCRVDDGIPRRLDRNPRLKALGNAIVPQVAEEIMQAIKDTNVWEELK